jgi:hypothetical protein
MALVEVKVPDIGDFKDVAVIELLVNVGDRVEVDQSLVTVESDKASMEIPSSHAGTVRELVARGARDRRRRGGAGTGTRSGGGGARGSGRGATHRGARARHR